MQAILTSLQSPHSSYYLKLPREVLANFVDLFIENTTLVCLVRFRLGAEICTEGDLCVKCGKPMDCFGDHCLLCMTEGDKGTAHHDLQCGTRKITSISLMRPVVECHSFTEENLRSDLVLRSGFPVHMGNVILDFAITHIIQGTGPILHAAIAEVGGAASKYALTHKHRKYDPFMQKEGIFVPMVVDTLGAWSTRGHFDVETRKYIKNKKEPWDAIGVLDAIIMCFGARYDTPSIENRNAVMSQIMHSLYVSVGSMLSKSTRPF